MNRRKWIYIGILIVVAAIVSIASFSYAFLTRVDEQHGKINIVAGTLDYKIESDDLSNNSITLSANESKEIEITIKSVNKINSKYQLYTNNVENVDIRYTDEEEPGVGTISSNGTKTVKIVLENNSDTDKTITFGVQGGFEDKTLTLEDNRVAVVLGERLCDIEPGTVYNFEYNGTDGTNGAAQTFTTRCTGKYKIEAWGAQGGSIGGTGTYSNGNVRIQNITYIGGNGGYTSGIIDLVRNNNLYVFVGGNPASNVTFDSSNSNSIIGGYNGGGTIANGQEILGVPGGGATDIRLTTGNWNDFDSLKSRIMVAAGGGGANFRNQGYGEGNGGEGGGLTGLDGYEALTEGSYFRSDYEYGYIVGLGGTQTHGSIAEMHRLDGTVVAYDQFGTSGFGYGGGVQSGAGSGYYGGGASGHAGAGGGSSFISGYSGCDAITETSTSSNIVHTGQANHYSGKVFTNGVMIDGKGCNWSTGSAANCGTNQPQPDGTNAVGHSGNGYARITYLGNEKVTFNANGGTLSEKSKKIEYGKPIGTLPTPTKSGKIFDGWYLDSNFTTKIDSTYVVENDITLYARYGTEIALNLGTRTQGYPSNTTLDGTTFRNYNMNTYVVGLSINNYYLPSQIYDYKITSDLYYVKQLSGYGIGLPMQLSPGDYKITATITSGQFSVIKYSSNAYDSYDASVKSTDTISKVFNIADNITHEVLLFTGIYIDASTPTEITATNIHLYKLD